MLGTGCLKKTFIISPATNMLEGLDIFHLKGGIHIAPSGVQKHFHTILGSRDISKTIWGIRLEELEKSIVLKFDFAVIYA